MALLIEFDGVSLTGAQSVSRHWDNQKFTTTTGAQGDQTRTRNHDVGHVVVRFAPNSAGVTHLRTLEEGAIGRLRVSGDPQGPDFESEAWLNQDRSQGDNWRLEVTKLPR